jgi:hypothetical protein
MANATDRLITPQEPPRSGANVEKMPEKKAEDRIADEMAEKAEKTEQHYDRNHNIFTK